MNGSCVCWRGYTGSLCSEAASGAGELTPWQCLSGGDNLASSAEGARAAANMTTFGVGLSGLAYWVRQLVTTDHMKVFDQVFPFSVHLLAAS